MKRINLIVKGKEFLSEKLGIRARKVERAVDSAADFAKDQILTSEAKALTALENMGKNADNDNIKDYINAYCDALDDVEMWKKREQQIETLKSKLNEEVENTDEE